MQRGCQNKVLKGRPGLLPSFTYSILEHKEISMTTKSHIIKAVFTPTLLFESENWTLTSKEKADVDNNIYEVSQKICRKD